LVRRGFGIDLRESDAWSRCPGRIDRMVQREPGYGRVDVTRVELADGAIGDLPPQWRPPPPPPDQATLADWMAPELLEAWEIIARDLDTPGAIVPLLAPDHYRGDDSATHAAAAVRWENGSGTGISVPRHLPLAERVVQLADQFQESEVEALWNAGRAAVWPHCPRHPNTHPLKPRLEDGAAVWVCGESDVIAPIGELYRR
jgi:hypothetical protein